MLHPVSRIAVFCVALALAALNAPAQTTKPTSFVDPLIGTAPNPLVKVGWAFDTGNVYPGAVCPRGMLAWSPDTSNNTHIAGGYWYPDNKIEDFSLTHFSGRGVVCLKDVAFMPLNQAVSASPGTHWTDYAATYSHQNESASAGCYRVKFENGIATQLAAAPRSGIASFGFPANASPTLLLRANGSVSVKGSDVSGYADNRVGKGGAYRLYFFAQFDHPPTGVKTWVKGDISDASSAAASDCGAILSFSGLNDPLQVRVGISYTSSANARDNLAKEIPSWDLPAVHAGAVDSWNKTLGQVELQGGTPDQLKAFYTALYHCFIHPNLLEDANGQYLGMDDKIHAVEPGHHQYQNIPAWDEHRSHSPLMAMLVPDQASDVIQSLVNYVEQDRAVRPDGGGLPRWEQVNLNSGGMVGDGDDTIIASSYAFGARQFDTQAAWEAMDRGASQPDVTSDGRKVRGGLAEYSSKGYVPESAAVTLEYCTDDFSISRLALSLGEKEKSSSYLKRSQNWKTLFDPATGYIRPRTADGKFVDPFTPRSGKGFIEGSAAQYFWMVNFNLHGLIDALGGNAKAIARLDDFFAKLNDGLSSRYAYMGNEPCEEVPWVYDFAGAPWRTQDVVRRIQNECFSAKPNGLPGNDDAGAISSWYVFSALGIYPEVPGVAGFVLGTPMFTKATIHLENGRTIQIIGDQASPTNYYVTSVTINGQPLNGPWIEWSALSDGGSIAFDMDTKPSQWGADPATAPPSFDTARDQ
jgi:predicted alpha-1,2-mannosidase